MRPAAPVALAACLLLAACSGGASGSGSHKPAPPALTSASAIGKAIGCDTPLRNDDSLAQVEKTCKISGNEVSIIRYPDKQTADAYVQMGSAFGSSYAIVNDHWMIAGQKRPLVARLARQHGWELQK